MSKPKISPIPEGPQAIIPHLSLRDAAKAIEFYQRTFGAVETMRMNEPSGKVAHAELTIGGGRFMLAEEYPDIQSVGPQTLNGTTVSLHVYVEDVDALAERAVAAGAKLLRPVADQFYGERVAWMEDPFGHRWSFASRIEDVSPEEMQRRAAAAMEG